MYNPKPAELTARKPHGQSVVVAGEISATAAVTLTITKINSTVVFWGGGAIGHSNNSSTPDSLDSADGHRAVSKIFTWSVSYQSIQLFRWSTRRLIASYWLVENNRTGFNRFNTVGSSRHRYRTVFISRHSKTILQNVRDVTRRVDNEWVCTRKRYNFIQ